MYFSWRIVGVISIISYWILRTIDMSPRAVGINTSLLYSVLAGSLFRVAVGSMFPGKVSMRRIPCFKSCSSVFLIGPVGDIPARSLFPPGPWIPSELYDLSLNFCEQTFRNWSRSLECFTSVSPRSFERNRFFLWFLVLYPSHILSIAAYCLISQDLCRNWKIAFFKNSF